MNWITFIYDNYAFKILSNNRGRGAYRIDRSLDEKMPGEQIPSTHYFITFSILTENLLLR